MEKTIIYNKKAVPKDMGLEDVLEIYYATKLLVYEDIEPYVIDQEDLNQDIVIIKYTEWLNLK